MTYNVFSGTLNPTHLLLVHISYLTKDWRLSWPGWLVTYEDGIPMNVWEYQNVFTVNYIGKRT